MGNGGGSGGSPIAPPCTSANHLASAAVPSPPGVMPVFLFRSKGGGTSGDGKGGTLSSPPSAGGGGRLPNGGGMGSWPPKGRGGMPAPNVGGGGGGAIGGPPPGWGLGPLLMMWLTSCEILSFFVRRWCSLPAGVVPRLEDHATRPASTSSASSTSVIMWSISML